MYTKSEIKNSKLNIIPKCANFGITILLNFIIYLSLAVALIFFAANIFQMILECKTDNICLNSKESLNFITDKLNNATIFADSGFKFEVNSINSHSSDINFNINSKGHCSYNKNTNINIMYYNTFIPKGRLKDNNEYLSPSTITFKGTFSNIKAIFDKFSKNKTQQLKFTKSIATWGNGTKEYNDVKKSIGTIQKDIEKSKKNGTHHEEPQISIITEDLGKYTKLRNSQVRDFLNNSNDLTMFQKAKILWPLISDKNEVLRTSPLFLVITITIATLGIFFASYIKKKVELMYSCKENCAYRNFILIFITSFSAIYVFFITYYYLSFTFLNMFKCIEGLNTTDFDIDALAKDIYIFFAPVLIGLILLLAKYAASKYIKDNKINIYLDECTKNGVSNDYSKNEIYKYCSSCDLYCNASRMRIDRLKNYTNKYSEKNGKED